MYKYVENAEKKLAIALTEEAGKYAGVIFTIDFENAQVTETLDNGDARFEFEYQIVNSNGMENLEADEDLAKIIGIVFSDVLQQLVEDLRKYANIYETTEDAPPEEENEKEEE